MKMKKIFLLFSLITVLISFTACSNGQETVNFEYNDNDIIFSSVMWTDSFQNVDERNRAYIENEGTEAYKTGLSNFDTAREECGNMKGYRAKDENGDEDTESIIGINIAALNTDEDAYGTIYDFLGKLYAEVEESGDTVIVTLKAVYDKRDVELRFVYEEEPSSAYNDSSDPYKLTEVTVTPEYTTGEKMAKAGQNTLMGMATVFLVLIFISLIIAQFDKLNKLVEKITGSNRGSADSESGKAAPAVDTVIPAATAPADPMSDPQLVAVITAAVMAYSAASGSSDRLIVRSIKKAKR